MENVRHRKGNASVYDGFIGSRVIVYYRDMRGTDRKLHGVLSSVEGDHLHLENGEWRGALNCGTARVLLVSTVTGWNSSGGEQQDAREQEEPSRLRVLIGKMFRR